MTTWHGIPREQIPWFPTIDPQKCTGCHTCVDFCRNDVLEFDDEASKSRVKNPYNCVVECSACAKICPEGAIRFPEEGEWASFIKVRLSRTEVRPLLQP